MDWKDTLGNLLASGTLPEGEEPTPEKSIPAAPKIQREPLHLFFERKGRKGKSATIITDFPGSDEELRALAKELKQRLGVGGSCDSGEILLQGDCRVKTRELLTKMGYKIKG